MTYQFKRPPREKQREALERLKGFKNFALLMAMRTGKTKVILDDWSQLAQKLAVKRLLIIAPAGVYKTWFTAIQDDVPDGLLKQMGIYTWSSGTQGGKKESAERERVMQHTGPAALLMNIEALSSVAAARETCIRFLDDAPTMVVVDESVIIKNPTAARTRFVIRELRSRAKYRRILSGLPTPRSPLDLYSQFEFLDPSILGFTSYYAFRARYAVMRNMLVGGRTIKLVVGFQNTEELWKKIEPYSFRVKLEDCYDLPASEYTVREVPLTDEQRRVYDGLRLNATAALEEGAHVTATQVIVQIIRMHQVLCGHTRDELGEEHLLPERRTETLLDLLEDYDGKAIIWCSYDADIKKVAAALEKEYGKVARFWGGNRDTREEEERQFKTDPECRFIVATPAAGGRGRTWDCANLVVYFSNGNDLDHRSQSEERPKAVGKTRSIHYVDLVAKGTVDEKIIAALRAKIDMAAAITGDNYQEWLI